MNPADFHFETTPTFQVMMWYWARAAEFTTPFLLAQDLTDEVEEQDELRPLLAAVIGVYLRNRARLLDLWVYRDFVDIYERIQVMRERHAMAWMAANQPNYPNPIP